MEDEEHGKGHKKKGANKENEAEGPTVDRMCPKCGFDKMSYATLQLRSADEGQTVFFTCLKCKFKESENSWSIIPFAKKLITSLYTQNCEQIQMVLKESVII